MTQQTTLFWFVGLYTSQIEQALLHSTHGVAAFSSTVGSARWVQPLHATLATDRQYDSHLSSDGSSRPIYWSQHTAALQCTLTSAPVPCAKWCVPCAQQSAVGYARDERTKLTESVRSAVSSGATHDVEFKSVLICCLSSVSKIPDGCVVKCKNSLGGLA